MLVKIAKVSANVTAMSIDAFENYIVKEISDELAVAIENAIINGKGASPADGSKPQPTGILTGVTFDASNSKTYSTSLGYDDLVDTRKLLKSGYRANASFVMNSNMEAELFKIKTTTNKPIFTQDPANGYAPKILGIPYLVDDYMPDDTILLANLAYYFMNFSQRPVIDYNDAAGYTSVSRVYRGFLIADGKPALDEAFVKLSLAKAA